MSDISLEEELGILNKIGTSDSFLDFGNSSEKGLEDLLKRYLKTTSGAKDLSRRLTQHLIVNLIDNHEKNKPSYIWEKLRGNLFSLRNNSKLSNLEFKEQEKFKFLFAGNDKDYQEEQVLKKSREIFESELKEVLNNLSLTDANAKFEKNSDADPFVNLFSKFWDHVLDDYIKYERPIPFKKLTWKYDSNSRKEDIKNLFDNPSYSLPEVASYYFPFISEESEKNFKGFLEKIKQTQTTKELQQYTEGNEIDLVIPISSIVEGKYTSQFSIAIIEVFRYLVYSRLVSNNDFKFLKNSDSSSDFLCKNKSDGIPSISLEKIKDKKTSDLFCLKKGKSNRDSENIVSDFIYLIQKQEKQLSWILFKDKEGIHALTYNNEVFSEAPYNFDKLKKHLNDSKHFNLKETLKKYLSNNFERLLLSYWDKFPEQQQQQQQAKNLSNFLVRDTFSEHLVSLRKILLRDYLNTFSLSFEKKNNWQYSFAGKFPYKFFESKTSYYESLFHESSRIGTQVKMIPQLENIFLSKPETFGSLLDSFLNLEESHKEYVKNIDKLFENKKGAKSSWKKFSFFKFDNGIKQITTKINDESLLNSIWTSLLQENNLVEVLFQKKIESSVKYFDFQKYGKDSIRSIGDRYSSSFKDSKNLKNTENLVLNYLHSQFIDLTKDLSLPQMLDVFDFKKVDNNIDKWKNFLEKTVKKFKDNLSSTSWDVSKGGILTDLFVIKWLSENNFENFRKHLRKTLQRDKLSAFVFSKKFSEKDKCLPNTRDKTKIFENLELNKLNQYHSHIFRKSTGKKDNELTCPINSDIVNFSSVTEEISKSVKYLTGYKGLVNGNWKDFLPEDIFGKLEKSFSLWKNINSLVDYIHRSINSESKYQELVEFLKHLFPKYNWDFDFKKQCQNFNFDWQIGQKDTSCLKSRSFELKEKKELLKRYIREKEMLDKFLSSSKNGWFEDQDGNYLIKGSDGSEYQIYLIQIKYDDVENEDSWKNYLKTIDSSYFFKELIKTAKDIKVKKQALIDGLTSSSGELKNFKTGDDRLRRVLGYSWLKNIRS